MMKHPDWLMVGAVALALLWIVKSQKPTLQYRVNRQTGNLEPVPVDTGYLPFPGDQNIVDNPDIYSQPQQSVVFKPGTSIIRDITNLPGGASGSF